VRASDLVNFEQSLTVQRHYGHRMIDDISDYERLCDEELAAADQATCKDALIEHLEQAFRFAKKASTERVARVVSARVSA
jgi:hypothetical protein